MDTTHWFEADEKLLEVQGSLQALAVILLVRTEENDPLDTSVVAKTVGEVAGSVQALITSTNSYHRARATDKAQRAERLAAEAVLADLRTATLSLISSAKAAITAQDPKEASESLHTEKAAVEALLGTAYRAVCDAYTTSPVAAHYAHARAAITAVDGILGSELVDSSNAVFHSSPEAEKRKTVVHDWLCEQCILPLRSLEGLLTEAVLSSELCILIERFSTATVALFGASVSPASLEEQCEDFEDICSVLQGFLATTRPTPKKKAPPVTSLAQTRSQHSFTTAIRRAGTTGLVLPGFSRSKALAAQRVRAKKRAALDTSDAETVVELFLEHFVELQDSWIVKTESEKGKYLQTLAKQLESLKESSGSAIRHTKTGAQLEEVIHARCTASLARANASITDGEMALTARKLAEATLNLIEHSSCSVVETEEEPPLEESVVAFFGVLLEVLKRLCCDGVIGAELVQQHIDQVLSLIEEKSQSEDFCVIDENVVKAASLGAGSKLIQHQMKQNIWNECNSMRILVGSLLCALNALNANEVNAAILNQITAGIRNILDVLKSLLCQVVTTRHIMKMVDSQRLQSKNSDGDSDSDGSIWDDSNPSLFLWEPEENAENGTLRAGTLNKLIQVLTSAQNFDNTFLKTFITTYRSFTTPWVLLSKLIERFNVPKDKEPDEKNVMAIQLRVAVVIKHWVVTQFYDFDEDLVTRLLHFAGTSLPEAGHSDMGKLLTQLITAKVEERKVKQESMISIPPTDLLVSGHTHTFANLFLNLSDIELARQLTLVDFEIYKAIQVQELLQVAWNSNKLKHRSPNVCKLLDRLNKVTMFVPTLVLWQTRKVERARVIEKMIRVGIHLRAMQNYTSLMGIVAGLNLSCLTRLKVTHAEVDPKIMQQFQHLEKLLDPSSSFKNYRKAFQNCKLPALPYIGVYLTDLTFLEDGNPVFVQSTVEPDKKLINFQKRNMVYNVLQQLQVYQQGHYPFPVLEPVHTLLTEMTHETEKTLYALSLAHEPRNADPKSII